MQIAIDRLDRPWGLPLQIALTAGWLHGEGKPVSIHTEYYDPSVFPSLETIVTSGSSPSRSLDRTKPTLVGPYPATSWAENAGLTNYSVVLPYIPWDLYPSKRNRWLGQLSSYATGKTKKFINGLGRMAAFPVRKSLQLWNRNRDRKAIGSARNVLIYDERLRKPVDDVYGITPELISPVAAIGQGKSTDPDNKILAVGPYEPLQNVKRIIDAFYLFVNRLGTQRRKDWDGRNPMQMWQSGDFTLKLHGQGEGEAYLKDYAETQQLSDQVVFGDWIPAEDYENELQSSLAVIDVPLGGDASAMIYHAMALGVPAVHTRHHRGLDALLEKSELSLRTKSTDVNHIAGRLLDAVRTPTSSRQPVESLKKALEVASGAQFFQDRLKEA